MPLGPGVPVPRQGALPHPRRAGCRLTPGGVHTGSPAPVRGTSLPRSAPGPAELAGGADLGVAGGTQDPGPSRLDRRPGAATGVPKLAPGGRRSQWGRGRDSGEEWLLWPLCRGQLLDPSLPCLKDSPGVTDPAFPSLSATICWLGLWGHIRLRCPQEPVLHSKTSAPKEAWPHPNCPRARAQCLWQGPHRTHFQAAGPPQLLVPSDLWEVAGRHRRLA